jgi:hypothetical protein
VTTPLLSQPLTGTVYLVQGIRTNAQGRQIRTLPTLLIPLRGQVAIDLRAQTSVDSRSRLVTTFLAVPDAAISSFTLTIEGGPHGILVVTGHSGLCRGRQTALGLFAAQSGASENPSVAIAVPCAKPAAVKRIEVIGQRVRLLVKLPLAGRLAARANGLTAVRRSRANRKLVRLTLRLTRRALMRLERAGKLRTRVTISYTPNGWPTQTLITRTVTFQR